MGATDQLFMTTPKALANRMPSTHVIIVALFPAVAFGLYMLLTAVTGAMLGSAIASPVVLAATESTEDSSCALSEGDG